MIVGEAFKVHVVGRRVLYSLTSQVNVKSPTYVSQRIFLLLDLGIKSRLPGVLFNFSSSASRILQSHDPCGLLCDAQGSAIETDSPISLIQACLEKSMSLNSNQKAQNRT